MFYFLLQSFVYSVFQKSTDKLKGNELFGLKINKMLILHLVEQQCLYFDTFCFNYFFFIESKNSSLSQ